MTVSNDDTKVIIRCDFCGKTSDQVHYLVQGGIGTIQLHVCDECICEMYDLLSERWGRDDGSSE